MRGAIDGGTSARRLQALSGDVVAHQQFTNLGNGQIKAWPKNAGTVEGIALALGVDARAVVLGFAADLGIEVRDSRSALATRLPAEASDLSVEQATTIAELVRWVAAGEQARQDASRPRLQAVARKRAKSEDEPLQ